MSTDNDAQLESLDVQKSHYEKYISSRTDWELAGIYFDEGITGTKKEKRYELLRMIDDCKLGKINFIITKSISRFSRNTSDCLEIVRTLLALNIPIYFEKEDLNTSSMESELILTLLSSLAESESSSTSDNTRWSIQNRFKNGTYKISYPPYGYDWDGKNILINESQATVVKRIFSETLNGKGTQAIATMLSDEKVPTKKNGKWSSSTINGMLKNEKYTGDVILQKLILMIILTGIKIAMN